MMQPANEDHRGASLEARQYFRNQLLAKMREQNLIPVELARRAKISKHAVASYTGLRSLPSHKTANRIAQVFGCTPQELFLPERPMADAYIDVREHPKPNHKLFVASIALPADMAYELALQLTKHYKSVVAQAPQLGLSGDGEQPLPLK